MHELYLSIASCVDFFSILFKCFPAIFAFVQSDSEYMAGQLSAFGYSLSDNPEEADLWLVNTLAYFLPSQI